MNWEFCAQLEFKTHFYTSRKTLLLISEVLNLIQLLLNINFAEKLI